MLAAGETERHPTSFKIFSICTNRGGTYDFLLVIRCNLSPV